MEQQEIDKIITLLKMRDVNDDAIEDFMKDLLYNEEDEEFNYLDKETMDKLKSSDKGKDLILKAPTMEHKALRKAIQDFLKE